MHNAQQIIERQRGPFADQRGQVRNADQAVEQQSSTIAEQREHVRDAQQMVEQQRSPINEQSEVNGRNQLQDDLGDEPVDVSLGDESQQNRRPA